jgi:6-phosphogluconate dehydrogenase
MKIGMVGLGKMGGNMTTRLLKGGHEVVVYDRNEAAIADAVKSGADAATSLKDLVEQLESPRAVWIMVPAGEPTEIVIGDLESLMESHDTIIDGGNSNYKDSEKRAARLAEKDINFIDVGTSGGIWGLTEGYSMMIGGDAEVVNRLTQIFETLAPAKDKGWGHVGPSGSGHFVKMIHNGIEYGMMQAYAEGFEVMHAKEAYHLDLKQVAEVWRYGSVVRSWLLDLTAEALKDGPELGGIKGWVADSGEGRWTVAEAIDLDVPAPVMTMSLLMRFVSRQDESYAAKILAAMRNQFGGHAVKRD